MPPETTAAARPGGGPTVLAFDTSAAHCAAALLSGGRVAVRIDEMARGQAEHLMGMLEEMLATAGLGWRDLDALGVCTGPGNFTGIRISVAAARGLALGLRVPAVGVSALEAQARGLDGPVVSGLIAPQGRAYVQGFGGAGPAEPALCAATAEGLAGVLGPRPEGLRLVGAAAETLSQATGWPVAAPAMLPIEAVARLAAERTYDAAVRPAPLYIRDADAAPPRDSAPILL